MRILSDASEYGLRAVVWLAQRPRQAHKTREIAAGTRTAPGYLIKALQALSRAEILSGQRGSHGGFTLLRDPAGLSILEVVNAVDPIEHITTCPLGLDVHGEQLCPLHRRIDDAVATIEKLFASVTVGELVRSSSGSQPLCNGLSCLPRATMDLSAPASPE